MTAFLEGSKPYQWFDVVNVCSLFVPRNDNGKCRRYACRFKSSKELGCNSKSGSRVEIECEWKDDTVAKHVLCSMYRTVGSFRSDKQ
jgi:hypothetical protein